MSEETSNVIDQYDLWRQEYEQAASSSDWTTISMQERVQRLSDKIEESGQDHQKWLSLRALTEPQKALERMIERFDRAKAKKDSKK